MVVNIPKNLTAGELDNGYKIRRAAKMCIRDRGYIGTRKAFPSLIKGLKYHRKLCCSQMKTSVSYTHLAFEFHVQRMFR